MPTIEELQAELAKRDEQIRGLSTRVQARDKVLKELGDAVEYDVYGNPMTIRVEAEPAPRPASSAHGRHVLAAHLGDEGDYSDVDAYYQALIAKQGYLTMAQSQQRENALRQEFYDNLDFRERMAETMSHESYQGLKAWDNPMSVKMREIMLKDHYAVPKPGVEPKTWRDYQYQDPETFGKVARMARAELQLEKEAQAASAAAAAAAAAAGNLAVGPATGSTSTPGKPNFEGMKSADEVIAALDQAVVAGTANSPA